nr:MAG TPA: Tape measure domain protein [Bacteriophage sp.]
MADGGDKILAQRELNNKKEMQAIDQAKEEYIQKEIQRQKEIFDATEELKAKKNPKYKKRSFDSSTVTVNSSSFDILKENTDKRQVQEDLNAQREAMNAYLAEYGTYMQKRQAIIEQYQDKINKATTEGEKLTLGKQRDRILSGIAEQANKTISAVSQLFGDMKDKTLKDLEDINVAGQKALEFLKSGQWDEQKGKELGITKENFETWSNDPEKIKAISDALVNNRKAADDLQPAYKKVADGIKDAFNAGNDSKKLEEALARIKNGLNDIMQVGSFLSDTFSSLGDAFGNDTFTDIADGINIAMDAANSAMQGAQAGSAFGPWGAAAGAAIGLVSSLASSIAKIHDKKNEKRIQELQDQIEVLEKSYERLGNSIEKAYSKDASNLINQQNKLLEQQKVLIQQQIREEQDKKKTDNDRIKEWQQQIEEINNLIEENKEKAVDAIFGEDVKTAIEDFASAYAEAWSNGEDRAESAKDAVKNIMRQMVTESIKSAIQASGSMEKIRQKFQEFYADNVLSGWEQNYIYNMAEELQKELDKQFGWADSLMKDDSKEQQSASGRGFGTEMTHEDAGELSGRFTAVYESNLRIETATQQQTIAITELRGSISSLITQAQGMYNIADETRTILANSYLELQQIRENTGEIIKPIKQIQKDIEKVKRNTSRL